MRETAARAAALGIKTELLRISSPHPVRALLELALERDAGLLVFGPDLAGGRAGAVAVCGADRAQERAVPGVGRSRRLSGAA